MALSVSLSTILPPDTFPIYSSLAPTTSLSTRAQYNHPSPWFLNLPPSTYTTWKDLLYCLISSPPWFLHIRLFLPIIPRGKHRPRRTPQQDVTLEVIGWNLTTSHPILPRSPLFTLTLLESQPHILPGSPLFAPTLPSRSIVFPSF